LKTQKSYYSSNRSGSCYSILTKLMKKPNKKFRKTIAFLPRITEGDPNYKRLKVYLFGTSHFTILSISKEHKIEQLISHVVNLADIDPQIRVCFDDLPVQIRGSAKDPELYEMRLLEDEGDASTSHLSHRTPLPKDSCIGEFLVNNVAFCRTKDFEEIIEYAKTTITPSLTIELETERETKKDPTLNITSYRKVILVEFLESISKNTRTCKR